MRLQNHFLPAPQGLKLRPNYLFIAQIYYCQLLKYQPIMANVQMGRKASSIPILMASAF